MRGTWVDFETQKGAKMEPKWRQNRTQDGPTSNIKTRSKQADLEDRLGAVLGRLGSPGKAPDMRPADVS